MSHVLCHLRMSHFPNVLEISLSLNSYRKNLDSSGPLCGVVSRYFAVRLSVDLLSRTQTHISRQSCMEFYRLGDTLMLMTKFHITWKLFRLCNRYFFSLVFHTTRSKIDETTDSIQNWKKSVYRKHRKTLIHHHVDKLRRRLKICSICFLST